MNFPRPEANFWRRFAFTVDRSRGDLQKDLLLAGLAAKFPKAAEELREIRSQYSGGAGARACKALVLLLVFGATVFSHDPLRPARRARVREATAECGTRSAEF